MEGNFITGKNQVVKKITKPCRNLESSTATIATAEKVEAHFRSQQVNVVDIQIQFDQAAKDDFNGQNKACFSNIDR